MRFDDRALEHLHGRAFNNALEVSVADGDRASDRVSLLVELCRERRVIDLGFADHPELIGEKIHSGVWLHAMLAAVAGRCLGIDISADGVARARELGYSDVLQADITGDLIAEVATDEWDLLVMGEVLEHIDDPVAFLRSIGQRYGSRLQRVVITVPNAFSARNLIGALRGREVVNSDHRYWFTPYTLGKVLVRAGFTPEWFAYCESFPSTTSGGLRRRLRRLMAAAAKRRAPALRPDLVMAATPGP